MKIYRVGGSIRDEFLGKPVKDQDFIVLGVDEAAFFKAFPKAVRQGREKPVYRVGADEYTISDCVNIEEDLMERDLTINAMAMDEAGKLYSHPKALSDLKQKILRPVRKENFLKDPLRVFRAARFAANLPDFKVDFTLLEAMKEAKPYLSKPAAERVGREVLAGLSSENPARFFRMLLETDSLDFWMLELKRASQVPAGPVPYHRGSLFDHLMEVVENLKGDPLLCWMGLCHDLGKLCTNEEEWPHHHGHDKAGEEPIRALSARLRMSKRFEEAGLAASRYHMTAGLYSKLRPGTRVDLLAALHRLKLVEAIFRLVVADNGEDFMNSVKKDLEKILDIHLPEDHGLEGIEAGKRLRELRCMALV